MSSVAKEGRDLYADAVNSTLDCIDELMAFPRVVPYEAWSEVCSEKLGVKRVLKQPVEK